MRALLGAPVKLAVIAVMWSVLLIGMYALSLRGIAFIHASEALGPFLLSRLWFLFLFVLMIMLAVSQLTGAYSTLVHAPETRWWMGLPVPARTLCLAKWIESGFYSAWAVAVLLLPMCLAYVVVSHKPLWLVGWIGAVLVAPLIGIVTALATILLLVWLRWFGRLVIRREAMAVGFVLACAALFWLLGERRGDRQEGVWFIALQELLPRMQVAMSMWLPSSWAATALDAGFNGRWRESLLYAGLLWTTMLLCWRALERLAAWLLLPVLRQHAHPFADPSTSAQPRRFLLSGKRVAGQAELPVAWWMRQPLLASLVKDVFLVLRDPMQWSQAVVFFGLLGAYFSNLHRFTQIDLEPAWRIGIASLNLACTLLVFGSLAVRFVFPQMSLEGRSLWLLRMAPHGMRWLLLSKLFLYGAIAVLIIEGLLGLSATRLGVPPAIQWWLAAIGVIAAMTLVGLTVGLGAWWIDPAAQDAARVVSSSNGALVLVFVLCYVGCVVGALVVAWTSWLIGAYVRLAAVSLGLVVASLLAGAVPVWKGFQRLQRLEYTA